MFKPEQDEHKTALAIVAASLLEGTRDLGRRLQL